MSDLRRCTTAALSLALGRSSGMESEEWEGTFAAAERELLAPLAWVRSGALIREAAPTAVSSAWRSSWVRSTQRASAALAALRPVVGTLEARGVTAIVLKGISLSARLYGDLGARPSLDIDLYVRRRWRADVERTLETEGWRCIEGSPASVQTFARPSDVGDLQLEVHSVLLQRCQYLPLPEPGSEVREIDGAPLRVHDDDLLPAYLAAHCAGHQLAPMLWHLDLAALWDSLSDGERAAAKRRAREAGLHRYLAHGLRRAEDVRAIAEGSVDAMRRLGLGVAGRRDAHQMWRHLACAPTVATRVRAAAEWIAPPWLGGTLGARARALPSRLARYWSAGLPVALVPRGGRWAPANARGTPSTTERTSVPLRPGERWVDAMGPSMAPTILAGDRALIAPLRIAPRRGMIVVIPDGGRAILHRVVSVGERNILTRGDSRRTADAVGELAEIGGRAIAVLRAGRVWPLVPTLRFGTSGFARYLRSQLRRARARASRARGARLHNLGAGLDA